MDFLHYGADMPDITRIVRQRVPPVPFMVAPLLLAVMAPFVSTQRRLVTFYLLVGCLYGVLALGRGTPFFDLYAHLPPGPATLRYPTRLFWICGFCMAVLSGFGIDALTQRVRSGAAALAPLAGAALLVALYLVTPGGLRPTELIALAALLAAGRLRLLATIEDRAVVEKILTHLGLPADPPQPSATRTPAWLPGVRAAADNEDHAGGHWAD